MNGNGKNGGNGFFWGSGDAVQMVAKMFFSLSFSQWRSLVNDHVGQDEA